MHTSIRWSGLQRGPGALLALFCISSFFNQSMAVGVNRTIDDVFGDSETRQLPIFLPQTIGVWKDQTCADCAIRPDNNQAFHKTYTSATYNPGLKSINVTMHFDGTAIYVFFILANNAGVGITSNTNCVFKLDGATVGTFEHTPDNTTTDIQYNVLAFSKTGISPGQHQLVLATENLGFNAYLNFDYAIYTHDEASPSSGGTTTTHVSTPSSVVQPTSSPAQTKNSKALTAGAIAGGVVGGLACLAIVGIVYYFYFHRRRVVHHVDLLGSSDDLPGTNNHGKPPPLNSNLGVSPNTIHTFAATGTPFTSALPQTSESSSPLHGLTSTGSIQPTTYPSHSARPNTHAPLRVANPDPQNLKRIRSTRQAELKKQLTIMRGEIEDLKADLRRKAAEASSNTESNSDSDVAQYTSQSQRHLSSLDPGDNARFQRHQTASVPELKEQIRMLTEQVAFLQAQQSSSREQGVADDSPPGYSIPMTSLADTKKL